MGFVGRKPTNAPLTSDDIPNGIIGAADLAAGLSKITFDTTPKTTGFTAVANTGYFCNTTSAGFTVTLPATPSAGDQVQLVDYAGTFDTNALVIDGNGEDIEGVVSNLALTGEREGVILTYIDSTQGWIATSGINEGTDALELAPYSVDFLVIAGGGGSGGSDGGSTPGGAGGAGGYRNSFSTETSGGGGSSEASLTFNPGTVYTITVGAGGAGGNRSGNNPTSSGTSGANSEISGTGISTITSTGGGGGAGIGGIPDAAPGKNGGSGGGGQQFNAKGTGTANQGFDGGRNPSANSGSGGGGGGAGGVGQAQEVANGGNGGIGVASLITGSSVTRAGGGGGGSNDTGTGGTANGGGGAGGNPGSGGTAGTVNTGGGAGGNSRTADLDGNSGGKGVVILRMPDASYSGTTTGSPTVNTNVGGLGETVIIFNDSGSITG